ncbi:MAG: M15 family metallopeptidase [Cyanobacteria bacterium RUI128]|nr:M15 family metallopeptidase [Cyanobacteria bacterium RUI128]
MLVSPVISSEISYDKSGFDKVSAVIDDAAYDIRYYSANNFTGKRIRGYEAPVPYMTKESLQALVKAADILRKQGYRILVWDAYRPQKAVDNFVEWINNPKDDGNKSFYPDLKKSDLVKGGYIATKSSHTRGSTIDLTLVKMDGSYVDMGGTFDLFARSSNSDYTKLTREQKKNRKILKDAMTQAGFEGIQSEWWHFTYKDEPYKDTYFDFDVR